MESKLITIDDLSSNWQFIDSIDIQTIKKSNPNFDSDRDSIGSWSVLTDDESEPESESESESGSFPAAVTEARQDDLLIATDDESEPESLLEPEPGSSSSSASESGSVAASDSVSLSVAASFVTRERQDLLIEALQQFIDQPKPPQHEQIVEDYEEDEVLDLVPARSKPVKQRCDFAISFYRYDARGNFNKDRVDVDEENNDDDDDDKYDVDDNLVPWNVSGKFVGRERMRKLGKRPCTKNTKAKRIPYGYNKPGCVYGKYGLGMKAY